MDADKFTDADADAEANEGAGGIQSRDALPGDAGRVHHLCICAAERSPRTPA